MTTNSEVLQGFMLEGHLSGFWRCEVRIGDARCNKDTRMVYLTAKEAQEVANNVPGSLVGGRLQGEAATEYILKRFGVLKCADCRKKDSGH